MKSKFRELLYIFCISVLFFFFLQNCENKKALEIQSLKLAQYTDSITFYKDMSGELVAKNQVIEIANANTVSKLEDEISKLKVKKPEVVIKYKNTIIIDSIPYEISIPCEKFQETINIDSTYYKISMKLSNNLLYLYQIEILNEQTLAIGKVKERWYKNSEYSVVIKNTNPYVVSTNLEAYKIKPKTKFYDKPLFWSMLGVAGGFYLGNKINK